MRMDCGSPAFRLSKGNTDLTWAVMLIVGVLHLRATFFGPELRPRDPALEEQMKEVSLVVASQTTVWKVWIGFNASQSLGLILFGVLYGYLSSFGFKCFYKPRFF